MEHSRIMQVTGHQGRPRPISLPGISIFIWGRSFVCCIQERSPVRPGQDTAERSQHQAIGGLPARPANLALQHRELVTQGQDLGPKPSLGLAAHDQGLQHEADYYVEEGVQHDRGSIAGAGGGRAGLPCEAWNKRGAARRRGSVPSTQARRHQAISNRLSRG
jgi:hypothetical protein